MQPDPGRPLKVLYFIDNMDSGGTQRQLTLLLHGLDPNVVQATLCTYQPQRAFFMDQLDPTRVRIVSIPKTRKIEIGFVLSLVRLMRTERFDLVHSFLRSSNFWGCLAGRLARVPCILASERRANFGSTLTDRIVSRVTLRMAHHVATNSNFANERLVRVLGVPSTKTTVIYNGIPTIEPEGHPPAGFIVSMAATLVANKNHRCVVEAFAQAYEHLPRPALLQFIGNEGDGVIRRELEESVKGKPCASSIRFLGRRSDIPRLFSTSHGVILASFNEAFPNVLLEAMLCACPTLASRVCENPWIVGLQRERGWLFDPRRPPELATALLALAHMDPAERMRMGDDCRRWVLAHFSAKRMVEETVQLYGRLLSGGPSLEPEHRAGAAETIADHRGRGQDQQR